MCLKELFGPQQGRRRPRFNGVHKMLLCALLSLPRELRLSMVGSNCWECTYCIEVGEEIHCSCSVQWKGKEGLNVQRWLQGRCRRTHKGWKSRALACTTYTSKETQGIQQVIGLTVGGKASTHLHTQKETIKRQYWIKQMHFELSKNYCITEKKHKVIQ